MGRGGGGGAILVKIKLGGLKEKKKGGGWRLGMDLRLCASLLVLTRWFNIRETLFQTGKEKKKEKRGRSKD